VDGRRLREGIASCLPLTAPEGAVRDALADAVAAAPWARSPLAERAADVPCADPALADVRRLEAALATLAPHAAPPDLGPAADPRRRLGPGVRVLTFSTDAWDHLHRLDTGALDVRDERLVAVDGPAPQPEPTALVLTRDEDGDPMVLDLDPDAAAALLALGEGAVPDLDEDELAVLGSHGVLVPVAWRLTADPPARARRRGTR
jgi:hypothetical protein